MSANNGKEAERAFVDRWESKPRTVVERLRDMRDLVGLNGGNKVKAFPLPSDYIITHSGKTFFAECKSFAGGVSFPFANIEQAQRSACLRQQLAGGDYRFYIFSYSLGQWRVMAGDVFAEALQAGRKSIKLGELPLWQ